MRVGASAEADGTRAKAAATKSRHKNTAHIKSSVYFCLSFHVKRACFFMRCSVLTLAAALLLLPSLYVVAQTMYKPSDLQKLQPLEAHFTPLRLGEVLPKGWLLAEVRKSLAGSIGHLDSLVPKLTAEDDIYGTNRLTRHVAAKDVGALSDGGAADIQFLWWNSETQSNWRDAYIRSAVLADDAAHLEQVRAYVAHILRTQDTEGYLGIYDSDMRYRFDKENGELWSKTTLLRGLLAWYEYLNDPAILTAIERAVQDVMTHYPLDASHPFASTNPDVGGTSHGLMFTDVLETLYTLTHKEQYRDYALFLYRDFSAQTLNEDAQYAKLSDDS